MEGHGHGRKGAPIEYNSSMILPAVPVLAFKFLFWALALAVFLRYLALAWHPTAAAARHYGAVMLLGVVLGAKLVYWISYPGVGYGVMEGDTRSLLMLAGAGSAPGALLGAAIALRLGAWRRAEGFNLDLLVVPAALAFAIIDIGSLFWALSEPGFGISTTRAWGMDFGDGVVRHPVMLYEAAFLLAAAWAFPRLDARLFRPHERALLFIAAYCGVRVLADYLRPPYGAPFITEMMHPYPWIYFRVMTGEQWVCFLALVGLLPNWLRLVWRLFGALRRQG